VPPVYVHSISRNLELGSSLVDVNVMLPSLGAVCRSVFFLSALALHVPCAASALCKNIITPTFAAEFPVVEELMALN
jgi:hypothetical protein